MNREIKFRAFDVVLGMRPVIELDGDGAWWKVATAQAIYTLSEGPLMQFTGLHDKNGDEIYEGDIVRGSWGDHLQPQAIVYQAPEFVMKTRIKGKGIRLSKSWSTFLLAPTEKQLCVILGNIHESPELLTI